MRNILLIILTLSSTLASSQDLVIDDSDLNKLYSRALNSRYDLLLSSGWTYIEIDEDGSRLLKLEVADRYKLLTQNQLTKLSLKKKESISLLRVGHKVISKDTIDINFGSAIFSAERKRNTSGKRKSIERSYLLSCGGTRGYQPGIRFAFDRNKNDWVVVSNRFVKQSE